MNWTEGKLARHSRARQGKQSKQILLRQKDHFAKARAGLLQNTSKQTPPPVPLFPSAATRHAGEFLFATSLHDRTGRGDIVDRSKKRRLSCSPRDHGLFSHSVPAPRFEERPKGPESFKPLAAIRLDDYAILDKRRKLLRETDWAGVRMQKPIPVRFEPSPSGNNKWTRRRRRSPNSTSRQHLVSDRRQQLSNVTEGTENPYKNQHVRITVGSQEVRLGEGSSVRQLGYAAGGSEAQRPFRGAAMPCTFLTSSPSRE